MNIEQERAEFEAWANGRCELHLVNPAVRYSSAITQFAWEAYQAGRAALRSQDREDAALAEILREAAAIIEAIHPEFPPRNMRWPIIDELEGFALMLDRARLAEGGRGMTSQEMMKTKAKPGNVWVNIAPLGEKPDWREVKSPHGPHSDPNYGMGRLFGYNIQDFMEMQYK